LPVAVAVGATEVEVVEALEQEILEGIAKLFDSARSVHCEYFSQMTTRGRWESSSNAYLIKVFIARIVNKLNCHVSTIPNATDAGVGQIEWDAKVASPGGVSKASDDLLLSG
jgi:hypothetical protein